MMTKNIEFLNTCMEKEEAALEETRNPRLQKIIEKRIALYKEQIEVLKEIEKGEVEDINALDYLFKGIKKHVLKLCSGIKTFRLASDNPVGKGARKIFLTNLLTNELPKNCRIEIGFFYDYTKDSGLSTELIILKNNIPFFEDRFAEISKEEWQKIAILYIKRGGKPLEERIQNQKETSENVIEQEKSIIKGRKKFLKELKEIETIFKTEIESKGGE